VHRSCGVTESSDISQSFFLQAYEELCEYELSSVQVAEWMETKRQKHQKSRGHHNLRELQFNGTNTNR